MLLASARSASACAVRSFCCDGLAFELAVAFSMVQRAEPDDIEATGIIIMMGVHEILGTAPFARLPLKAPRFDGVLDGFMSEVFLAVGGFPFVVFPLVPTWNGPHAR